MPGLVAEASRWLCPPLQTVECPQSQRNWSKSKDRREQRTQEREGCPIQTRPPRRRPHVQQQKQTSGDGEEGACKHGPHRARLHHISWGAQGGEPETLRGPEEGLTSTSPPPASGQARAQGDGKKLPEQIWSVMASGGGGAPGLQKPKQEAAWQPCGWGSLGPGPEPGLAHPL